MNNTQQKLLEMYHPSFREGYQAGRQHRFQEQITLTDMQLVENLQALFQEEEASQGDESVYYAIGHLVGQMSGGAIARQPSEDNTQALQDAFLARVRQTGGANGPALIESIQHFWALQDQLAQMLGAESFLQMIQRGAEPKSL